MKRFGVVSILITVFSLISPSFSVAQTVGSVSDTRLDFVKNQLIASGLEKTNVVNLLSDNRIQLLPVKTVAYKAPNWNIIRQKLYSKTSVQTGVNYIKNNQATFDAMEKYYGISSGIIVGIMAIETDFGRNTGSYSVFNVIYSRMKLWPATTWKSQANQLIALSKYCLNARLDCLQLKGSYAGAIGLVQFMPNSLLTYGVDGDGNGIIDLQNPADAIPSAANFLLRHGWLKSKLGALTSYYGSSVGYPNIVLTYSSLVIKNLK